MNMKRVLSMFLVLILSVTMCMVSFADEVTEETEPSYEAEFIHVMNYVSGSSMMYNGEKVGRWGYFTPYKPRLTYDGVLKGSSGTSIFTFNLIDSKNNRIIDAYCADTDIGVSGGYAYSRLNLENSSYSAHASGKLRAIVKQGFWDSGDENVLGAAAGVPDLTQGEALAATQLAIWETIHGDRFGIVSYVNSMTNSESSWAGYHSDSKGDIYHLNYDSCYEEVKNGYASMDNAENIATNIEAAYNYLMSLEDLGPSEPAVSGNSFKNWEVLSREKNEDGTYNITVNVELDVIMKENDDLTLSAIIGGKFAYVSLADGINNKTLVIKNVPAANAFDTVTLAIDGQQTVKDVFIFAPKDARNKSQTLIAEYDAQLPVHAEVEAVEEERIINFHKLNREDNNGLEGVQFDIYYKATVSEYLNGEYELDYKYSKYDGYVYTAVTDENGEATVNLTRENLPDGVYLIVEKPHNAIEKPVDPFYVIIPATSFDGTGYEYVIDIYPKNDVKNDVEISKDVISIDNDSATVDAKKEHTWIITAGIPDDLENGKSFVISDTLDNRLNFLGNIKVQLELKGAEGAIGGGSVTVSGENTSGKVVETTVSSILSEGIDYIIEVTENDSENGEKLPDSFKITFTSSGMANCATLGKYIEDAVIRVYFDAEINSNANMDDMIPNKATLEYTNSVGVDFKAESDIPEVYTGGIQIIKVDADNQTNKLEGAQFEVYRKATEAEIADENISTVKINGQDAEMVIVEFFSNPEITGEKVTKAVSDENGKVYIYGLAYGTYYLLETKAPDGYNLLAEAKEFEIKEATYTEENAFLVFNKSGVVLPETGGVGTTWFIIIGSALAVAAVVILVAKRRMNKEE